MADDERKLNFCNSMDFALTVEKQKKETNNPQDIYLLYKDCLD